MLSLWPYWHVYGVFKIEALLRTAHRVLQIVGQVFRYAVATGRTERDITPDLKGA
ncbi:phage integrase central domain-containing protein, partial [Crenothrix sp.]|uniref:phage integrase central domain-containing protein n=1 Tax=Crenothrix sp. TaxID=3100433 RepID=UPI00374CE97A